MPMLADYCLDLALGELDTAGNRLDIHHTAEPTTYANAIAGNSVGNKVGLTISAPADRTPNGRKVTVSAITDGTVTATHAAAAFWSIVNTTASRLLASGALAAPQAVTSGNVFTTAAFDVGIPDAV